MSIAQPVEARKVVPARLLLLLAVALLHVLLAGLLAAGMGWVRRPAVDGLTARFLTLVDVRVPVQVLDEVQPRRPARSPSRPLRPAPAAVSPRAITQPLVAPPPVPTQVPRRALDLSLPGASAPPEAAPVDDGWVFDRKLARRLEAARRAAGGRGTLAARQRAREGVSSDEYARASGNGERVKTESGCFELREDPDAGGTRWWREPCQDTRVDAWDQEPFEAQE